MTDTPPPGASVDARVHGDPDALAQLDVRKFGTPRRLSADEAKALLDAPPTAAQPQPAPVHPLDTVVVDASVLKPQLTALVRWALHGVGIWLISYGMSSASEAGLEPIAAGLVMSGGALAWSLLQKRWAADRIETAAHADPAKVVLR